MENYKNLLDITLISATSVDIEQAAHALLISSERCQFSSIKLLSPKKPSILNSSIEHVSIPPMDLMGYSKFMLQDLYKFVDTKFCLVIQSDGFVINPNLWTNQFLEYDYIGAPWPNEISVYNASINKIDLKKNRVGNGGFSLRSKRLLEVCSHIKFDELDFPIKSEDIVICHYLYQDMLEAGIKFAPFDLARKFSVEIPISSQDNDLSLSFGFHGKHWLSNHYLEKIANLSAHSQEFLSLLPKKNTDRLTYDQTRIGRLQPCPCGSAMRFKDCHGKLT